MAKMYSSKEIDSIGRSERKVYEYLKKNLENDIIVCHSVYFPYNNRGESDFIIIDPKYGILILEVKGGQISYNGKDLISKSAYGTFHEIDPIGQAEKNLFNFIGKLKKSEITRKYKYWTDWAVCFPDAEIPNSYDSAQLVRERCMTISNLDKAQEWLENFYISFFPKIKKQPTHSISQESIEALITLLVGDKEFNSPLVELIKNDKNERIKLTKEQYKLLNSLECHKEALICGCAGSGKTFLAVEKAKRLAQEGLKIGLICWSHKLALFLKNILKDISNIQVYTATKFINENFQFQFDALIVDEGQDIPDSKNWDLISSKLIDNGIFYIFYDDNQKIFHKDRYTGFPIKKDPYLLTENCRNTDKIHTLTLNFYQSNTIKNPISKIKSLKNPKALCCNNIKDTLSNILNDLILNEKIKPKDIIILTPKKGEANRQQEHGRPPKMSMWSPAQQINEKYLIYHGQQNLKDYKKKLGRPIRCIEIECSTIQSFKGLEKPIVILTELDKIIFQANVSEVLYVGLSRCVSHLIILFQEEASFREFNKMCNLSSEILSS